MPYARDLAGKVDDAWVQANGCLRHLGLYAYKAELLEKFASLPVGRLERIEKLEQLRVLENGFDIAVGAGATNLRAMVPTTSQFGALTGIQRLNEATTSFATITSPLWNGTPCRMVMVLVRPSSLTSIPSASIGTVA